MSELPFILQLIATGSAFVIKPTYMVLMLFAVWHLHKRNGHDLMILKYGVAVFLLGEIFCSINYLFFSDLSNLLDWAHGFCMVIGLSIISLGIFLFFDSRVIFYSNSNKPCAFVRFCYNCEKYSQTSCGLKKLFIFFAFALSTISLMPLISPLIHVKQEVFIFGAKEIYYYPAIQQFFDLRIYPIAAFMLFVSSAFILLAVKKSPVKYAKYTFAFGIGFFVFSIFRYILLYCYKDQMIWKVFWEEFTELLLILGILLFLFVFSAQIKKYKFDASR